MTPVWGRFRGLNGGCPADPRERRWGAFSRTVGRSNRAFTLIEVMIVVALLALVLATGIPSFVRARKGTEIRNAVRDVVEACSQARAYAILRGAPMEVVIVAEGGSIRVQPIVAREARPALDAATSTRVEPNSNEEGTAASLFSARLADEIAIELLDVNFVDFMQFPEAHVVFFPNGTSDEFTIVLHWRQEWRKISLESITALAEVEADPRKWR